ncbi:hypothetical protein SUGI_0612620 [Cryptomeria japonica]|uniref:uncharacterized protein LOC131062596 n=1 Tax=Cryptomeria japonica TaxID=3369 RepID=UPI0024148194|nr:uncharacterized protein LOC131062596 [Cryptomeria japonica]GLJ30838.1 hypothetical protein SUGI_0612620 [Cryptomeria japonica]
MKALAAYPFSSLPHPLPPIQRPSSFTSTIISSHCGYRLSIRAVNEGKEQDEQRKGKGKGKGKSSLSSSRLTVEDLEAMSGAGRSKRSKNRSKVKRDADPIIAKPEVKDWESMTLQEKLTEIYVGEKGVLFWLNKLAYASIFIVVGGWIAFRFVGPSLGLYQLQSSLLEPTKSFGG